MNAWKAHSQSWAWLVFNINRLLNVQHLSREVWRESWVQSQHCGLRNTRSEWLGAQPEATSCGQPEMGVQPRPLTLRDIELYQECVWENKRGGGERRGEDGGTGREGNTSLFPNLSRFLIRITFSYSYEKI